MSTEPPLLIANRKELTYLLCQAAELEHGLLCEYLYAAFSLKTRVGPGVNDLQLEAMERWRSVLLSVATQEMLHWALVNNILTAVGSAAFVSRPNMPHAAKGYPPGVQLALLPFGERALRHFVFLERPEGMDLSDAEGFDPAGSEIPRMSERELLPRGQQFATVGHLYRAIEQGLVQLAGKYGEHRLFIGPPHAQANPSSFRWPDLEAITDLDGATRALERIVEQGEGARGDWSSAHYGRLLGVLEEYLKVRADDPTFEPAHPVTAAGVRAVEGVEPEVLITDPDTAAVSDLCNVIYDLLLQIIVRYFAFGEESDEELAVLTDVMVDLMVGAIKPLALLLATLPVGPERPEATAGANFQLAYRASFLLPHKRAAWIRFSERLEEAAEFTDTISLPEDGRTVLDRVVRVLRSVQANLDSHIEAV